MDDLNYTKERYTAPGIFNALEATEVRLIREFPQMKAFIRQFSDHTFSVIEQMLDARPPRMCNDHAILPRELVVACAMQIGLQVHHVRMRMLEIRSAQFPSMN